jgi:hypothetical protein
MKWRHRIAQGFSPGSGPNEIALKALPTPRTRGAIPDWRSTPILQYSITPRGRIRGRRRRGRERSASRGRPMRIAGQSSLRPPLLAVGVGTRSNHLRPKHTAETHIRPPFSSFVPRSRNYGGQAGRVYGLPNPGLKPWAMLFRHFMAICASPHHSTTPPLHHSTTPPLHHSGVFFEHEDSCCMRFPAFCA